MPKNMKAQKPEILRYLQTHTWKETATQYNVSEQTLARWKKEKPKKIITPTIPRKPSIPKVKVVVKVEMIEIPAKFEYALKMLLETGLKAYKNKSNPTSLWLKDQGEKILEVI